MTRANTLTEIWDTYNNNILSENVPGTKAAKMGTKPGKKPVLPNDIKKGFNNNDTTGPENAEKGESNHPYSNVLDPKHNGVEDELYNSEKYSSENYNKKDKKIEKKVKESINIFMKSTFDKLFENVMGEEMGHSDQEQELDALGIDTEVADSESDEVTITLDRDMAKSLCDMLQAAMGDEDADDDSEDADADEDYSMEMEEAEEDKDEEEEDDTHQEAVEMQEVPSSAGHSLMSKNNKVGSIKAKGKKASDSTKKYVEAEPKELGDKKAHLQGKNNKVGLHTGQDFFE